MGRRARYFLAMILGLGLLGAITLAHLAQGLSPGDLRALLTRLVDLRALHPLPFAAGYFLIYVTAAGLSLPLGLWLSLLAGALFGFWGGLALVSFASSCGALLAFLMARHVLGTGLRARLGPRLARLEAGIAREGGFFLASLRLIPVMPFAVVNLGFGLTSIPAGLFYVVSQLGMLPGSSVYVMTGTQLAGVTSFSGLMRPALLGCFVLLAALPWVMRFGLGRLRARRALPPQDPDFP